MSKNRETILVIGDTHLPFELENYLEFCLEIYNRCKCKTVVHIGDLVDNHSISYHEHNPDGKSPKDELIEAKEHLKHWFKAFPRLFLCRGNHDSLVDRKGKTVGLPEEVFKPYREIWDLPKSWRDDWDFELNGVRFQHGTGYSGKYGHIQAAYDNRQSTVIGHTHSSLGGEYIANYKDRIFGMNVGCGIDRKKYAFTYGRDFRFKPIIGCGIVSDCGSYWQTFAMEL